MDIIEILRALFGLGIVLGLIVLCGALLRRTQFTGFRLGVKGDTRLGIVERIVLDARRQVVLLREGEREHLILLGANGETLIESREARHSIPAEVRLLEPGSSR
jgi:flagellar protein FliO/FliZ